MPSLAFIYWPEQSSSAQATQIRSVSLAGVVVGAILSGHSADRYGRRKIYGFGLFTLLIGILGIAQASAGFDNATMSFLGWFLFWQFLLGCGVGETITSTAILISEYSIYHSTFVRFLTCSLGLLQHDYEAV
jgi:PHS family inorganic phosphate transporter-like MFS transporter